MFYKSIVCVLTLLTTASAFTQNQNKVPVPVIFDTDIGPDYDDAGAITILHGLADSGEAKILATIASNKYEGIAAVLSVFNTFFNQPDIPIGVPTGDAINMRDSQHWTDTLLVKYPHRVSSNNEVPDAVKVYRKALAAQPDHSVTIITVGFLTNLSNLLASSKDEFSKFSGRQLVERKVKKLVTMGGAFPSGKEFNLEKDASASKDALENWPTPVIFSGFEIGAKIKTGLPLINNQQVVSPVKDVFRISIPKSPADAEGRMSWDEVTVLVAIRGHRPFFNLHPGKITINADGTNKWNDKASGQYYLVSKENPKKIEAVINQLMMHQPKK